MIVINFIRGFFMALADSVPGVSGGTIAFIMGFYDDFINSLNTLVSKSIKMKDKKEALFFLGKLGIGWICGFVIAMKILGSILDKDIYPISSLFLGFILFSIPLIIYEEKKNLKKNYFHLFYMLFGILLVSLITYLNPVPAHNTTSITFSYGLFIFIAGMIAISAMVLPGISGSTLLVILGLYTTMVPAVKSVISFDFQQLPMVILFGLGVVAGVVTIIPLLRYLLTHHRPQMVYLIIGLMLGSLYAIVMGPTTLDIPKQAMDIHSFNVFFFLIGGLLIFLLDEIKRYMNKHKIV